MKTTLKLLASFAIGTMMMFSCQKAEEPVDSKMNEPQTRAYGDTPVVAMYVETNDVNPLNAGDYELTDGTPFVGIVELFASNIEKTVVNGVTQPTLKLNDKMTRVLEPDPNAPTTTGYHKYVKPLQDKGIKVLLTVLGNWQDMGVANMNDTQTTQFAQIVAYVVNRYNLDGVGFDDEYAGYTSTNNTSYSQIIKKVRNLLPNKIITVFDWGNTDTLDAEALAMIDYAYHGFFGTSFISSGLVDKSRWSPMSLNLGYNYNTYLSTIYNNALRAKNEGYGALMCFNLRRTSDVNSTNVFITMASAMYGQSVVCDGGDRPQDWDFISTGLTFTYADVLNAQ